MGQIDFTGWPTWLVVALLILNLFREQIGAFVPIAIREHFSFRAKRKADREEYDQEIREVQLNARLQKTAAEQLRKSWREENLMEILKAKEEWQQELYRELATAFKQISAELQQVHQAQVRTNDLLTVLNATLTEVSDALKVSNEAGG